ncbi:MAG: HD domain-containing phosphohydrolase [Candidatus Aenigmatarchaeota archaeon]
MIILDSSYMRKEADRILRESGLDDSTYFHSIRVGQYMRFFANALSLGYGERGLWEIGGELHDVGKSRIPANVLHKKGQLTDAEFDLIKRHTLLGYGMTEHMTSMESPALLCRNHHENYDGSGYPDGLREDEINLSSRAARVADTYDALRQRRPYKTSLPHEEAMRVMLEGNGRARPEHFDPQMLAILHENGNRVAHLFESIPD